MSPKEASEILDEPNWNEEFKKRGSDDYAFESVLTSYRRWHWTPIEINGEAKKQAASATDGIIALALLGVMPPRSLTERRPGHFEAQVDAHCWFLSKGRAWRVWGILDGWLIVNSFGEEWHIDLKKAKWESYVEQAAAALMNGASATPRNEGP